MRMPRSEGARKRFAQYAAKIAAMFKPAPKPDVDEKDPDHGELAENLLSKILGHNLPVRGRNSRGRTLIVYGEHRHPSGLRKKDRRRAARATGFQHVGRVRAPRRLKVEGPPRKIFETGYDA